jgi:hypothetical protein
MAFSKCILASDDLKEGAEVRSEASKSEKIMASSITARAEILAVKTDMSGPVSMK